MSTLCFNFGVLLGFIVGAYIPYDWVPIFMIISIADIVLIILFVPDTPQFLLKQGDEEVSPSLFQSIRYFFLFFKGSN